MSTKESDLLNKLTASSMLVACARCGSTATYRGSPKEINEAAEKYYELHERCYQRTKATERGGK